MSLISLTCNDFSELLASKEPIPGGGGAAALVGALGAALASMVSNLTTGKKKYAAFEEDIHSIITQSAILRMKLLECVDKDAEAFAPLAKAYSIPKDDPSRVEILEQALQTACLVPIEIIRLCLQVMDLLDELVEKGSMLALSDVGCGASLCRAAAESASLSVFINTKSMTNRVIADKIDNETVDLVEKCSEKSLRVFETVRIKLVR